MAMATAQAAAERHFKQASFPPAQTIEEKRRQQSKEDVIKLHRACRLLRMALGADRRPGGTSPNSATRPRTGSNGPCA